VTKQEFVDAVAARAGMTQSDAAKAVDAVLATITDTLRRGDSITFTGFGKFSTSARAARQGVHPRTGERVAISATTIPKFSPGSALKQALPGKPVPPKPGR
jgi:DNA-binding protein HU-beta